MHRKSILGIILFLLTLALTILHGSLIDKYIQNHQLSNQIKKGTIQQISNLDLENSYFYQSPELQFIEAQNFHNTQTVIPRKNQSRLKNISTSPSQPTYEIIDILWILLCSGLVFIMQPGFMCLESGLTRSKNSINVAIKNFTDFGISVACFWSFGFAFMFGSSSSGIIGHSKFFLATDLQPFDAAFFLFQAMFCGTATTIVSGAVAERMKFASYLFVASL
ncbi:MAG: hypothetical protein F6K24_18590, partial [Okeania sp. SIO2D1]|nr:hypothetical protein [Okeania sp. SIO2D1]